nr:PREDICTED: probable methyltransferase TARBP1 [Lepisosteus oculatus]
MTSVLIDVLLLNCRDFGAVLDSLCWGSDSWPQTQTVEALSCFIRNIASVLDRTPAGDGASSNPPNKRQILDKVENVVWDHCFPLLFKFSREKELSKHNNNGQRREIIPAVCGLLNACLGLCGRSDTAERVVDTALPFMLAGVDEDSLELSSDGCLDADIAVEVIAAALPFISSEPRTTHRVLIAAFTCIRKHKDHVVSKVTIRILSTLLNYSKMRKTDTLQRILEDLSVWQVEDSSPSVTGRILLCLTALSDHMFSLCAETTEHPDPRLSERFWKTVQNGLIHRDNVSRKRALYLLKRCIAVSEATNTAFHSGPPEANGVSLFWWAPDQHQLLLGFWEDYILIMETLDENQIHVVRPVLNRINKLMEVSMMDRQDRCWFHPSWLVCVYRRMFDSENKTVMRVGVCHLLDMSVMDLPMFSLGFSEFIVGPFLDVLAESTLFNRSVGQSIGECPELAIKLQRFLVTFISSLPKEKQGSVLLQMVQNLACRHWCAVPLLFISQALSQLPCCSALGLEGLCALREVLRCTMITHQVLLRGAAQCFLLHSALNLTDVTTVTLEDVFSFLKHFRTEESLCRGALLWTQLCNWLHSNERLFKPGVNDKNTYSGNGDSVTVCSFVQNLVESFLRVPASTGLPSTLPDWGDAELVARAILLAADLEEQHGRKSEAGASEPGLGRLLGPLMDTLHRLSTNVYLPVHKTDKSLQLLLALLQLCHGKDNSLSLQGKAHQDSVITALEEAVLASTGSVLEYILRRLSSELCTLSDIERCRLYLSVLRELVRLYTAVGWHRTSWLQSFILSLLKSCLRNLQLQREQCPQLEAQVQRSVSMASLAWVCEVVDRHHEKLDSNSTKALAELIAHISSAPMNQALDKPDAGGDQQGTVEELSSLQGWGRVAAQFVQDQWTCLHFVFKHHVQPNTVVPQPSIVLKAALEALAILPCDHVLPVLCCMRTVLPKLLFSDASLCVETMTVTWKVVQGLSSNPHDFWTALQGFVLFAFDHSVLELSSKEGCLITSTVKEIASELIEMSQVKMGVFNILIKHCCETWLPPDPGDESAFSSALNHLDIITEACIHGPVFRRDQRLIQDVQTYVEQLGDECAANTVVKSDWRDDLYPRVCAITFLSRLDPSNNLHKTFMEELVLQLLKKDEEVTKSKVRYYGNSLQHRVKNRVWQTLLVLLPRLEEGFVASVLGRVYEAGFCSNQASVKYLIEWLITLVLFHHPALLHTLWACFLLDQEKTKTSICTFLSVLIHFDIILQNVEDKGAQWRRALGVTLQWCFSPNFTVRLYALLALKRLWGLQGAAPGDEPELGALSGLVQASLQQTEAMQGSGNAVKNWQRIQDHFFFGTFHPLKDYSIETIFYTFPSLSELADDEWIPVWKFERHMEFPINSMLPLRNLRTDLGKLEVGHWIQQDKCDGEKELEWVEVQKKMMPWKLCVPDQDLELVYQQRAARLGKLNSALLVVASLIDKPTNLGGLCRTCEIFGASALVLDSLHYVSDKHFQALSVSAELWFPLLEVKPPQLADYLEQKKTEGYSIVGVEQTANSQSLADYKFPEKTLLLLGNEREGIPANLLQLLDVCVEIPQFGVTRSLNVHVSGALLVWEYTRQHMGDP